MQDDFKDFLNRYRKISGIDLSLYNQAQVFRRFNGIILKHKFATFRELSEAMERDPQIREECLRKSTIHVTDFFRDKVYWDVLQKNIEDLARYRLPLRIWSAGCSTGEEAYSLAYMLSNLLPKSCWELMASDLDRNTLTTAVAGIYHAKSIKNLEEKDLTAMFAKAGEDLYQVKDRLRQRVSFFRHDLLLDTYPANLDIIVCRNVIIYFNESAKIQVFNKFTRALNPKGMLFIGGSEQIMAPEEVNLVKESIYFYRKKN